MLLLRSIERLYNAGVITKCLIFVILGILSCALFLNDYFLPSYLSTCHENPDHDFSNFTVQYSCEFDYTGPLREEDINCLLDVFTFSTPVKYQTFVNGTHDIRGIRFNDNTSAPIPIFIPFRDRISVLIETIRSFHRHIRTPFELVIINDNSTYPTAVNFLNRLSESGVYIHNNMQPWNGFDELYEIFKKVISEYMEKSEAEFFILTDPDTALDSAPGNILSVYQHVFEVLNPKVVGALFRWDDWPVSMRSVPGIKLGAEYIVPKGVEYYGRIYYYIQWPIDTTFAMYRKGEELKRYNTSPAFRMLPPLGVRHLDFYLDHTNPPADYVHYLKGDRKPGKRANNQIYFHINSL
jgi:hypothetical protein